MLESVKRNKDGIRIHADEDFAGMRAAGKLAASALDMIAEEVKPGIATAELDRQIYEFVMDHGAVPATIGYRGYRHASCISTNHVICHGIPSEKALKEGDITNIDVTVIVKDDNGVGWHGDTSRMFYAGEPKVIAKRLVDTTFESLWKGIEQVKPGATLRDIGFAIQRHAEAQKFAIVREFCGHGLGQVFHDAPNILHFGEVKSRFGGVERSPETKLEKGMFFTIEPMLNAGKPDMKILKDGWTAVTRDKSLSAQFEHSLGVTDDGFEIFTKSLKGYDNPPYQVG